MSYHEDTEEIPLVKGQLSTFPSDSLKKSLGVSSFASLGMSALLSSRILRKNIRWIAPKGHILFGVLALVLAIAHMAVVMYSAKKKREEGI